MFERKVENLTSFFSSSLSPFVGIASTETDWSETSSFSMEDKVADEERKAFGVFVIYFVDEDLKFVGKNLLKRLVERKPRPTFVNELSSLKENEYCIGKEETENLISLFYLTKDNRFEKDIYLYLLHFFSSDEIYISNYVYGGEKYDCFFGFLRFNSFPFFS